MEKRLSGRLQAGIKAWSGCLKGEKSPRHLDDLDSSMMAHKPGGDPDLLVSASKRHWANCLRSSNIALLCLNYRLFVCVHREGGRGTEGGVGREGRGREKLKKFIGGTCIGAHIMLHRDEMGLA